MGSGKQGEYSGRMPISRGAERHAPLTNTVQHPARVGLERSRTCLRPSRSKVLAARWYDRYRIAPDPKIMTTRSQRHSMKLASDSPSPTPDSASLID